MVRKDNETIPKRRSGTIYEREIKVIYNLLALITPKKDGSRKSSLASLSRDNKREEKLEKHQHI